MAPTSFFLKSAVKGRKMRLFLAFRVFFLALLSGPAAQRIANALQDESPGASQPPESAAPTQPKRPPAPSRSEAITLLATLQREARFVDFICEPLDGYSDAQVGAASRDVHRDCATVIERLFAPEPILSQEEGSQVEVPEGFDRATYKLTGNVTGQAPFQGQLVHGGWRATKCDLPSWTGSANTARVIAPVDVELK